MKCVWSLVIGVSILVPSLSSAADLSALLGTWEIREEFGEEKSLVIVTFDNQSGPMVVTGQTSGGFPAVSTRGQDSFSSSPYAYRMFVTMEGACLLVVFNLASPTAGAGSLYSGPRTDDRCGEMESANDIAIRAYSPEETP